MQVEAIESNFNNQWGNYYCSVTFKIACQNKNSTCTFTFDFATLDM